MQVEKYCRFKAKMTVNGYTHLDGFFTVTALGAAINTVLNDLNAPVMNFDIMHLYIEGAHFHYDMKIGNALVAFEVDCVADPDGARKSEEPLPHKPSFS